MSIFEILKKYCSLEDIPYFAIYQGTVGMLYDEVKLMGEYPFDEKGFNQMVMHAEKLKKDWKDQKNNINTLAKLCKRNNLKMLIIKGYAMSLLYDRPDSRNIGDVDVFFFRETSSKSSPEGKGTEKAGDIVDDVVRSIGAEITSGWRHTTFDVRETHVENHRHFVEWNLHPKLFATEEYLMKQIVSDQHDSQLVQSEEWREVYYPSANFNAVFLATHMGDHFVNEGACLRHLVDWVVFLDKCGSKVDWSDVYALADKCGYRQWINVLNAIAIDIFGIKRDRVPTDTADFSSSADIKKLEDKVMKDIAGSKPYDRDARVHHFWKYLFERTRRTFHDRWKLRMVYDENPLIWYLKHVWKFALDYSYNRHS